MKLLEQLKIMDPEEWIYVGSKVNFMWIGQVKDAFEALVEESAYQKHILKECTIPNHLVAEQVNQKKMESLLAKSDLTITEQLDLDCYKRRSVFYEKHRLELYDALDKWTELFEREVKEIYLKTAFEPLGKVIIIEGREIGSFWSYDEFQNRRRKEFRDGKGYYINSESERRDYFSTRESWDS